MTFETDDGTDPPTRPQPPARNGNAAAPEWPGATRPTDWFLRREEKPASSWHEEADPVVGPTAALSGRPGGPGFAVPPGTAAGMSDDLSVWEQAHDVWQDSGVSWERDDADEGADEQPGNPGWAPPAHYQTPRAPGPRPFREPAPAAFLATTEPPSRDQPRGGMLSASTAADAPPRYRSRPQQRDLADNAWKPPPPVRRQTRRRRGVTPMTFVRLGVPAVVIAGVGAVAVMMLIGRTSLTHGDQATPATSHLSMALPAAKANQRTSPSRATAFSQVSASEDTVVAVGSQASAAPSFRVSADGGRTWTTAVIRSQAGPVTGHQATLVAGGPGGWAALGPHAIWSSANGTTWTLVSARGLAAPGETITSVTKDSWGYLATGTSTQSGTGLVWTSPNGVTWHRATAAGFGLVGDPGEHVFAMTDAGTDWNVTLVAGSATKDGKTCAYVWRSLDKGASWRTVVVPQTNGGNWSFTGLAGDAGHFIAVRPGTGTSGAVVYTSDDAINWHYAATIVGPAGFTPQQVTGGSGRFVITGRNSRGLAVAYTSTDNGTTWTQSDGFGVVPSA